jgi:hypothetical protein
MNNVSHIEDAQDLRQNDHADHLLDQLINESNLTLNDDREAIYSDASIANSFVRLIGYEYTYPVGEGDGASAERQAIKTWTDDQFKEMFSRLLSHRDAVLSQPPYSIVGFCPGALGMVFDQIEDAGNADQQRQRLRTASDACAWWNHHLPLAISEKIIPDVLVTPIGGTDRLGLCLRSTETGETDPQRLAVIAIALAIKEARSVKKVSPGHHQVVLDHLESAESDVCERAQLIIGAAKGCLLENNWPSKDPLSEQIGIAM